jgi:hypothetical protein
VQYETNFNFNSITRNARPVARHWRSWPACLLPLAWRLRTGASRDPRRPWCGSGRQRCPQAVGSEMRNSPGGASRNTAAIAGSSACLSSTGISGSVAPTTGRSPGPRHRSQRRRRTSWPRNRRPRTATPRPLRCSAVGWDTAAVEAVEAVDGPRVNKKSSTAVLLIF